MKESQGLPYETFDGLSQRQLLIYARELGDHFRKEHGLQRALSEREQKIQELAAAVIAAQEEERQWLAYEVHDRLSQALVSVFQQVQILESMTRTDIEARQVVLRTSDLVRQAIREARNIINDLHPPILDEFGLAVLMEEELRQFREHTGCEARFDADYQVEIPKDVEVGLYRIFHEAIINVRRHATQVGNLTVTLTGRDHIIGLDIHDDGCGFDIEAATQDKQVGGLVSMRRRAEIIGGTFEMRSKPGEGTTVSIGVPIGGNDLEGRQ